jgi:hypothetical protein
MLYLKFIVAATVALTVAGSRSPCSYAYSSATPTCIVLDGATHCCPSGASMDVRDDSCFCSTYAPPTPDDCDTCEADKGVFSECRDGQCVCKDGYSSVTGVCLAKSACASDVSCPSHSTCSKQDVLVGQCTCAPGFASHATQAYEMPVCTFERSGDACAAHAEFNDAGNCRCVDGYAYEDFSSPSCTLSYPCPADDELNVAAVVATALAFILIVIGMRYCYWRRSAAAGGCSNSNNTEPLLLNV